MFFKRCFLSLLTAFIAANLYAKPVQTRTPPAKKGNDAFYDFYDGELSAGLNYPGISLRYGVSPRGVLELKIQSLPGLTVIGPRYYCFLSEKVTRFNPYYGFELDVIPFSGTISRGTGYAGEAFIGVNEYFSKKIFLGIDIGPAYVYLSDLDTLESAAGLDFVMNLSLNYVFK